MTYLNIPKKGTLVGREKLDNLELYIYKDISNSQPLAHSIKWSLGYVGLTSKLEEELEKKLEPILEKTIQELTVHGNGEFGKLVEVGLEMIYLPLKESLTKVRQKLKLQMNISNHGQDITKHLENTKKLKQNTETGRRKFTSYGENQELERVENALKKLRMDTGKQETNGGTHTTTTPILSSMTFTDGSLTTSYLDSWTDIHSMYQLKEDLDDLLENGFL